ncbi:MAG: hypothetical protein KAT34_06915 [Candidatus Aminicenantes bacterium]|nr:hypothetical protein [Candidatus Aminicenantes bacterium]
MGKRKRFLRRTFNKINHVVTLFMKLSIVVAVILGLLQLHQSNQSEKRLIAIDAVKQTRTVEFLKALTRLREGFENKKIDDMETFRDNLNYVMGVYDNIAILYLNDVVDKCIIKESVESGLNTFVLIIDSIENFPFKYRENIDLLRIKLSQLVCKKK